MTSAPTVAIASALCGERYTIPFGGVSLYNYAPDVRAGRCGTLIGASRALDEGAHVFNVPGSSLDMPDVIAALDAAVPEARGLVDFDASVTLPIPPTCATAALGSHIGDVPVTPFGEALAATVEHFRRAA